MRFKDWFEVAKVRARKNDDTVSVGTTSYKKDYILDLLEEDFEDCYNSLMEDYKNIEKENEGLKEKIDDLKCLNEDLNYQVEDLEAELKEKNENN